MAALVILSACEGAGPSPSPSAPPRAPRAAGLRAQDPLDAWFKTDFPTADGFDFALDTRRRGDVRAVAHGRVAFADDGGSAWGHVVMIDHVFYENHERRGIRSVYARLAGTRVRAGEIVKRRDVIGTVAGPSGAIDGRGLRLELRWDTTLPPTLAPERPAHTEAWIQERYAEPEAFIRARRRLAVPQDEPALLVVSSSQRKMRVWLRGKQIGDFEVGFGQQDGRKRRQHDLRTPLGMYFVIEKSRGPFAGPHADFYGGHWIKVNYPNAYDAAWGLKQGLLTSEDSRSIGKAWSKRLPTSQGSPLGGGIGLHGWSGDWDLAGPRRLSWGCVVMRNEDLQRLFEQIPVGAMVVIL